jgi:hypothetical protein
VIAGPCSRESLLPPHRLFQVEALACPEYRIPAPGLYRRAALDGRCPSAGTTRATLPAARWLQPASASPAATAPSAAAQWAWLPANWAAQPGPGLPPVLMLARQAGDSHSSKNPTGHRRRFTTGFSAFLISGRLRFHQPWSAAHLFLEQSKVNESSRLNKRTIAGLLKPIDPSAPVGQTNASASLGVPQMPPLSCDQSGEPIRKIASGAARLLLRAAGCSAGFLATA